MMTEKHKTGPTRNPWMAVDLDLATKPETQRICDLADEPTHATVGLLVMFWSWVDRHAESELLAGLSCKSLVRLVGGSEAFWQALVAVGWLEVTDEGLVIPGFDDRFSASAKQRMLNSRRQDRHRMSQDGHDSVTPERDSGVTDGATPALPRRRVRQRERNTRSSTSTSTSDVGDRSNDLALTLPEAIDWDQAKRDANRALAKLNLGAHKEADRSLMIKAAALKQRLSEDWFWDAIEGTAQIYQQAKPPQVNRFAYLTGIWKTKCAERSPPQNFNALLKLIEVPEELLRPPKPPP